MSNFDIAVSYVLEKEGGLVERESDPGGITNYGISLRFLKHLAEKIDIRPYGFLSQIVDADTIRNLTIDQAKDIYLHEFWNNAPFEKIDDQDIATYLFDMAINMGIAPAIKCAQRACWSTLRCYNIINDDGIMGDKTLDLINQAGRAILSPMRSERAAYYRLIMEVTPSLRENNEGWFKRAYGDEK